MAAKPLPSQEVLRQLLDYDPETGVLRWKERGPDGFKTARSHSVWNAKHAGGLAFRMANDRGYLTSCVLGRRYSAHRVVWKWVTGQDPDHIDHINGVKADNRFSNLRNVAKVDNQRNRKKPSNNTSGVIGVTARSDLPGKWIAYIGEGGKTIKLGSFETKEAALAARRAAEERLGYHENHGR